MLSELRSAAASYGNQLPAWRLIHGIVPTSAHPPSIAVFNRLRGSQSRQVGQLLYLPSQLESTARSCHSRLAQYPGWPTTFTACL